MKIEHLDDRVRYLTDDRVLHRTNGPAVLWHNGYWYWALHNIQHRYYGPATGYGTWYICGRYIK